MSPALGFVFPKSACLSKIQGISRRSRNSQRSSTCNLTVEGLCMTKKIQRPRIAQAIAAAKGAYCVSNSAGQSAYWRRNEKEAE